MAVEPTEIISGDFLNWVRSYETVSYEDKEGDTVQCKSTNHTLTYYFVNPDKQFELIATSTNDDYEILANSTVTEKWPAGEYTWAAFITHSTGGVTRRWKVDNGTLNIKENLAVISVYDGRSHIKKVLDALETAIEGRADKSTLDWISYAIAGRSRSIDPRELRIWYGQYRALYDQELAEKRIANNEETQQRILFRL